MTTYEKELRMAHINTIDELLEVGDDTPEVFGHATRIRGIINVLPLAKKEKRALIAYLWRDTLEDELKT